MKIVLQAALAAIIASAPFAALQAEEVDVLARSVARGEILSAADFRREEISNQYARDVIDAEEADGMEAGRNLREGYALRSRDVVEPRIVHRGDQVVISLRKGALTIEASGRALDDGAMGEKVRVFSETTNRTLEGTIEAAGQVRVTAG